jgi:hypothetical protein
VADLARRGFRVTAVDIASVAVAAVRGALQEGGASAEVVQADLLCWQPKGAFDAVYEQTCLCALDPGELPAYTRRLYSWLRPGGQLLALFMQTEPPGGPPFHCGLPAMRALLDAGGWRWPRQEPSTIRHPGGLHELATVLTRRP